MPGLNVKGVEAMLTTLIPILFGDKRGPGVPAGVTGRYLKLASLGMWGLLALVVLLGPIAGFLGIDTSHIQPEHLYTLVFGALIHTGAAVAHAHSRATQAVKVVQALAPQPQAQADTSDPDPPAGPWDFDTNKNPGSRTATVYHAPANVSVAAGAKPSKKIALTDYGHFRSNLERVSSGVSGTSRFQIKRSKKFVVFEYPDVKDYMAAELCRIHDDSSLQRLEFLQGATNGDGTASRVVFELRTRTPGAMSYHQYEPGHYRIIADDDVDGDDNTRSKDVVDFWIVS